MDTRLSINVLLLPDKPFSENLDTNKKYSKKLYKERTWPKRITNEFWIPEEDMTSGWCWFVKATVIQLSQIINPGSLRQTLKLKSYIWVRRYAYEIFFSRHGMPEIVRSDIVTQYSQTVGPVCDKFAEDCNFEIRD